MIKRRNRFKQTDPLEQRLSTEADKLRKLARGTPPGIERDSLLRRARQCDDGAKMSEWLRSAELRPPE